MTTLASASTLTLAVANTALNPAQPVLYVGQQAQLLVTLTNNTGADLGLQTGTNAASTLDFYLPKSLALQPDVATLCAGIGVPGWMAAPNPTNPAVLRLTFVGGGDAGTAWANGASIRFPLANVHSAAAPTTAAVVAVPANVSGTNVPDQVHAPPLSLQPAPPAGAVSLAGRLAAELDNEGILYISTDAATPLTNTLQLNFKNTRVDADGNSLPLYVGATPWADLRPAPQPQITAWFVYDGDGGGLAPDDPAAAGSAWNIALAVAQDQTGGWTPSGPEPIAELSGPHGAPQWLLQPAAGNTALFGAGDAANLTVAFNDIVSLTPAGHTQLYLAFTGFWQDETTAYEPLFLTLDVNKEAAPPPKVLSFSAPQVGARMTLPINQPGQQLSVQFKWSLTGVASIALAVSEVAMPPYTKKYDTGIQQSGVVYDTYTVRFPPLRNYASGLVIFTLTAYDAVGKVISNNSQITFYIDNQLYVDGAGQVYPTVQVGNQVWMAQNLNYDVGAGCSYYNSDPSYATPYGRLYTFAAAQQNVAADWRLPTEDDFSNLIDPFGWQFPSLIAGGNSGFEGQLGGACRIPDDQTSWIYVEAGASGSYWSSSTPLAPDKAVANTFLFFRAGVFVVDVETWPTQNIVWGYSVRYVRDIDLSVSPHRS